MEPGSGEEAILSDLNRIGYRVGSLAELRHSGVRYQDAVPVLVDWLPRVTSRKIKQEIVRALSRCRGPNLSQRGRQLGRDARIPVRVRG